MSEEAYREKIKEFEKNKAILFPFMVIVALLIIAILYAIVMTAIPGLGIVLSVPMLIGGAVLILVYGIIAEIAYIRTAIITK